MTTNAANKNGLASFDHVVVLMLENRSFDNLLGYLYDDKNLPADKKFDGLQNPNIEVPVPDYAKGYHNHKSIKPFAACNYHQPFPDPGEVYQHVNTQLYNFISDGNCDVSAAEMHKPYNLPDPVPHSPPMTGFVKDYINTLNALSSKKGKKFNHPDFDLYSVIMQCFKPEKIPVLTTLAREFAVFDHWYCSVPSQTWCNRSFWHAGTSGGKVVNPTDSGGKIKDIEAMISWAEDVWTKETLFERMHETGVSHAVYIDNPFSLTSMINGPFKDENVIRHGPDLAAFKQDIANGSLPQYSFIEPKFLGQHNDQHPSSVDVGIIDDDGPTRAGTVILGEKLICDVYNSLFSSETYRDNTLLIITYDEHGGCFDHVPPPSIPSDEKPAQKGFRFNRLGVRVPMVMVSAYLNKHTIINEPFEHCSFIKTMCEKWGLSGLTERDKYAPSFSHIFSDQKRTDFPPINCPDIKGCDSDYENDPLSELHKSLLVGASYLINKDKNRDSHDIQAELDNIKTVGEAIKYLEVLKQ